MFGLSPIELITIGVIVLLIFRFRNSRFPGPPWPQPSYNPPWTEAEDLLRRRRCAANQRLDSERPPGTMMDSKLGSTSDLQST
jgi:hypothetical protein